MSFEPKLEIYKLCLLKKEDGKHETFRGLFRKKFGGYRHLGPAEEITLENIFDTFLQDFVKTLDTGKYKQNKKKAFTLAKSNSHVSVLSPMRSVQSQFIYGTLDGGKHNQKRKLGKLDNTDDHTPITNTNIVSDLFYFLIHTPLNSSDAIVFIQSYSETGISDIFKNFLEDYFKYQNEIKSQISSWLPPALEEKYRKGATFKSIKFTTPWRVQSGFEELDQKTYDLVVKVEIEDRSQKKLPYEKTKNVFNSLKNAVLKMTERETRLLGNFGEKEAKITNGVDMIYDIDTETVDLKPVIKLREQGIIPKEGDILDFKEVHAYCKGLLNQITEIEDPNNDIEEL
ncbi:MAG: hypothetical protein POELPBGB_02930 [Bacteroidia bacterium]|nr:hypothetical protein [Bacteroidia bacterium]